jgi:hypothetical protein
VERSKLVLIESSLSRWRICGERILQEAHGILQKVKNRAVCLIRKPKGLGRIARSLVWRPFFVL